MKYKERLRLFLVVQTAHRTLLGGVLADGNHRVPNVNVNSDGDFNFNLGNFENDWNDDNVLLCFSDHPGFFRYRLAEVFSPKLFFHPPSITPTSSSLRISEPYRL